MIVAPAIAGVAVGVGVPILLAYIYGVVPVSLCQNGVCGVSTSPLGVRIDFDDEEDVTIGGTSGSGGIGPGSALALASGAQGTALNPGGGTLLGELSDKNSSTDTHGRSRHHHHRHSSRGGSSTSGANTLGSSGNGKHNSNTDAVSLDASSNLALVGNPSIGMCFSFNSTDKTKISPLRLSSEPSLLFSIVDGRPTTESSRRTPYLKCCKRLF